eukprot:gene4598-5842_t
MEAALSDYNQVFLLNPNPHHTLWTKRGKLLQAMKRYERAKDDFYQALKQNKSAQSHYNYGLTLTLIGDAEEAIIEYREALRLDSVGFSSLVLHIIRSHIELGEWRDALLLLREAEEHQDLYTDTVFIRAELYAQMGYTKAALHRYLYFFNKGIQTSPTPIEAHVSKCNVDLGLFHKAVSLIREAVAKSGTEGKVCPLCQQREVYIFWWINFNRPFAEYNVDREVDSFVRAGWITTPVEDFNIFLLSNIRYQIYEDNLDFIESYRPTGDPDWVSPDTVLSAEGVRLLQLTS